MKANDLKVVNGEVVGSWIKPRLGGSFGAVTLQVPQGFGAYARILHPATDLDGNPVRWADVAGALGTTAHREMQWHAILGLSGPEGLQGSYRADSMIGSKWLGNDPAIGEMRLDELDALCQVLAAHTGDTRNCFFGLCVIESWLNDFTKDEMKPLLELPWGRDHIVLAGPLSAVDQIARDEPSPNRAIAVSVRNGEPSPDRPQVDRIWRRAPNLIWPADRTWFVASEVDFDSTLVGGAAELVQAIVDSPAMEAWAVEPTTSLAVDADNINTPS
jgi:hypothetical protein